MALRRFARLFKQRNSSPYSFHLFQKGDRLAKFIIGMKKTSAIIIALCLVVVGFPGGAVEKKASGSKRYIRKVSVKLVPCWCVTGQDGKLYKALKLVRGKHGLELKLKGGKKLTLPYSAVKHVVFGHTVLGKGLAYGDYSRYRRHVVLKGKAAKRDEYSSWKSMGGRAHWSDTYGNYKKVKR